MRLIHILSLFPTLVLETSGPTLTESIVRIVTSLLDLDFDPEAPPLNPGVVLAECLTALSKISIDEDLSAKIGPWIDKLTKRWALCPVVMEAGVALLRAVGSVM